DRQVAQRRRFDGAHQRAQHRAHEFLEQALLVAEVKVDRALGDAGATRELVERGRQDGGAAFIAPSCACDPAFGTGASACRGRSSSPLAAAPDHPVLVLLFMTDWSVIL